MYHVLKFDLNASTMVKFYFSPKYIDHCKIICINSLETCIHNNSVTVRVARHRYLAQPPEVMWMGLAVHRDQ